LLESKTALQSLSHHIKTKAPPQKTSWHFAINDAIMHTHPSGKPEQIKRRIFATKFTARVKYCNVWFLFRVPITGQRAKVNDLLVQKLRGKFVGCVIF
jgi:hypothetical protein